MMLCIFQKPFNLTAQRVNITQKNYFKPLRGLGEYHDGIQDVIKTSCVCVSVAQSCPTRCNPMGCSPPGSLSKGLSRQEYWSGLPFPSPMDLPDPGIKPRSPALQTVYHLSHQETNKLAALQTYETILLKRVEGNVPAPATLEISIVFKTKNKLYISPALQLIKLCFTVGVRACRTERRAGQNNPRGNGLQMCT